jgi:hypothetical protein
MRISGTTVYRERSLINGVYSGLLPKGQNHHQQDQEIATPYWEGPLSPVTKDE